MRAPEGPQRLGRGLAALFGEEPPAGPSEAAVRPVLPIAALEAGPFQPRTGMDPDALAELAASIRHQGVLQPILARPHPERPDQYQIIAGERRWRAAALAGLTEIPVLIRPLSDTEAMAAALVENLQRQDLDAIEEAQGYWRLLNECDLTQERLGDVVGKSRSHIANTIRLLQLPGSVRDHIQTGALSAGHARALLAHPEPEAAARVVIAQGLNVRQTETLASRKLRADDRDRQDADRGTAVETAAVARALADHLGLRVQLTSNGRGGTLRIHYQTREQLDHLIVRLGER